MKFTVGDKVWFQRNSVLTVGTIANFDYDMNMAYIHVTDESWYLKVKLFNLKKYVWNEPRET